MLENATIIVGTDLTEVSRAAVEAAAGIAERFGARRLVLAHGVKEGGPLASLTHGHQRAFDRAKEAIEAVELQAGACEITRVVRSGPPARVVVEIAEEEQAELIVLSSHGFGAVRRTVVGSVANAAVRAARCPVLVVGPDRVGRGPVERVTAAVDMSPVSERVVRSAMTFGCSYRAPVRLISVCEAAGLLVDDAGGVDTGVTEAEVEEVRAQQRDALASYAEQGRSIDVEVETELLEGDAPPDAILADVKRTSPSLLVIGTSGHDGWHRLVLGATADQVMCESSCPVLIVPAEAPALEGCRSVA